MSRNTLDEGYDAIVRETRNDTLLSDLPVNWLDNPENTPIGEVDRSFNEMEAQTKQDTMPKDLTELDISRSTHRPTNNPTTRGLSRKTRKSVIVTARERCKTNRE